MVLGVEADNSKMASMVKPDAPLLHSLSCAPPSPSSAPSCVDACHSADADVLHC